MEKMNKNEVVKAEVYQLVVVLANLIAVLMYFKGGVV